MSDVIKSEGWDNWGKASNEKTARFLEYKNTGKGGNLQNKRIKWAKTLTEKQAKNIQKKMCWGKILFSTVCKQGTLFHSKNNKYHNMLKFSRIFCFFSALYFFRSGKFSNLYGEQLFKP